MNRRKAIKLILLGSASVTSLISYKWLDRLKATDVAYLFDKQHLIAELAETIIPETDTPGAKAVKVEAFITRMLTDCTDARSLNNFIIGLQELEEYSILHYNRSFTFCTAGQKEAILKEFEDRAKHFKGILGKIENKILGRPFFTVLKNYTVMGFCTSRLGATQALHYDANPGRFENVGPIDPAQRSWATK
jgi:Gluconate 2-dehydrogenase subunit 3